MVPVWNELRDAAFAQLKRFSEETSDAWLFLEDRVLLLMNK